MALVFNETALIFLPTPHSHIIPRPYWRAVRRKTLLTYRTNRAVEALTLLSGSITFAGIGLRSAMELTTGRKVIFLVAVVYRFSLSRIHRWGIGTQVSRKTDGSSHGFRFVGNSNKPFALISSSSSHSFSS